MSKFLNFLCKGQKHRFETMHTTKLHQFTKHKYVLTFSKCTICSFEYKTYCKEFAADKLRIDFCICGNKKERNSFTCNQRCSKILMNNLIQMQVRHV